MGLAPDISQVYPKTGLSADLRFDETPFFISTGSMGLDGSNDRLDCDGAEWASTGAWTIACWVKCLGTRTSAHHLMSATDGSNTFDLYISGGSSGNINLHDGNSGQNIASNQPLFDGTWHHLALTCGAGGGATATLYFDGQVQGTITVTCDDLSSATTLHIGQNTSGGSSFKGNISNFGIWESALSQASIISLMLATSYTEVVSKSGATPRQFWILDTNGDASVGQNGTLTNGAAITGDRCRLPNGFDLTGNRFDARLVSGRGIDLDGAGDFIDMGHPSDLDGFFNTGGTLAMWINMTSTATFDRVFDFTTGTYVYLYGSFSGYQFNKDFSTSDGAWTWNGNGGVSLGEWFHFCLSYDASSTSNNPDLYINGVLQTLDNTTTPTGSAAVETSNKRIGSDASGTGNLDASLAHIKFITSTVTAAQALEMCNNPEQILPTGIATSALKAWLPCSDFDIASSDNSLNGLFAQDASGNGNHGALTNCGMVLAQPIPCPQLGLQSSSSRIFFDQTDDMVSITGSSDTGSTFAGGGTITCWFFAFSDGEFDNGIIIDMSANYHIKLDSESSGTCDLTFIHNFDNTSGDWKISGVNIGQWNHFVVAYNSDSDSNDPVIYLNGSPQTVTESVTPDGTAAGANSLITIGNEGGAARTFHGFISELALYKGTILDSDAVTVIYNGGVQGFDLLTDSGNYDNSSDLDGWWKLDNPVTIEDLSTNSNTGTVSGSPNMMTIPEGTTADRSVCGTLTQRHNQHVFSGMPLIPGAVANGGALQFAPFQFGTDNFSIHFWYKISHAHWGGNSNARLLHSAGSTGYINLLAYQTNAYWCVIQGASGLINLNNLQPGTHNVAGDWVQICVRREAAALFTFHSRTLGGTVGLDNDDNSTVDIGAINLDSPFGLRFGAGHNDTNPYNNASGASFCGVRIYKGTAITDAQVNELFEADARILRSL